MNKQYLVSKMKSSGTAYLCWFFFGCHYAYLGKWGLQIAYWLTIGGLGIWAFVDLFRIPSLVNSHNYLIGEQIEHIEKQEKEENYARNFSIMKMATGKESGEKKIIEKKDNLNTEEINDLFK